MHTYLAECIDFGEEPLRLVVQVNGEFSVFRTDLFEGQFDLRLLLLMGHTKGVRLSTYAVREGAYLHVEIVSMHSIDNRKDRLRTGAV